MFNSPKVLVTIDYGKVNKDNTVKVTAKKKILVSKYAYLEWIRSSAPLKGIKKSEWKKYSPKDKVRANCQKLCAHNRGIGFTFEILPD